MPGLGVRARSVALWFGLALALGAGARAHAQSPSPYPTQAPPPTDRPGDVLLHFAVPIYDVFCWSDVLSAEVLSVNPRAGAPGLGFPLTEVRARVIELYHERGQDCQTSGDALHVPPIAGLPAHEIGPQEATLRFVSGIQGSGPYSKLLVPRREPYFFAGQRLFMIVPESQRRPLAFEISAESQLFDPGSGRRVLYVTSSAFALQNFSALQPAAAFFLAGAPGEARSYPTDDSLGDSGIYADELLDSILARLEHGPNIEEPAPEPVPGQPPKPTRPDDGIWGNHIGEPDPPPADGPQYPAFRRDVWDQWSARDSGY